MDNCERRDVRREGEGVPRNNREAAVSPEVKQRNFLSGGITMVQRKQTGGSSKSSQESSGNARGLDPASPPPAQGKRPQQAIHDLTPRPVAKRLKMNEELCLHVLLPNGTTFEWTTDVSRLPTVTDLATLVRQKAMKQQDDTGRSPTRTVKWGLNIWLENDLGQKLDADSFAGAISSAKSSGTLRILVFDGQPNPCHRDKNLFDITPKPEMLGHLPQGYTLETALADQVDNALQAVWHNPENCDRLVSVDLAEDKITIFDTGHGMDATEETSIQNWGTVGGSTHRDVHHKAIGGKPPFLTPYLGKYGAGGVAAALHLGSSVKVWSKTVKSNLVICLELDPKALVEKRGHDPRQRMWKTDGTFRAMTTQEKKMAPHGSFTRVEISKLKSQYCIAENGTQYWKVERIRQLLKDIYFPYIQVEIQKGKGTSSKTVVPVLFQVNGKPLVEIMECETAICNLHTCNGEPFIFDIRMTKGIEEQDREEGRSTRSKSHVGEEANARVTCRYYPNLKGKESLETVLEELKKFSRNSSTFETMPRVTVRWLGRLLPEVKWPILPLMEVSRNKGKKSGEQRSWSKRVRAFVDTDAGFHPNQSKTELERDQPFAVALKNTGSEHLSETSAKGVAVRYTLKATGSDLSLPQLCDAYKDWVKDMHSNFDEDFIFLDDPIYIFNHSNAQKDLGVEDKQGVPVLLFYKHMKDAGGEFKVDLLDPFRIRIPKGEKGLKSDLFATVEFFFHDGSEDENGDVKFLCRPLDVDDSQGCKVMGDKHLFLLNQSLWFSASVLSTAKRVDAVTWAKKNEELFNKSPHKIEILKEEDIQKLEMSQVVFPVDDRKCEAKFEAGYSLPAELLVVVRPKKGTGPSHKQGMIVKKPMDIVLTVRHCGCASPCWRRKGSWRKEDHGQVVSTLKAQNATSKSNVAGLYMFNMGSPEVNRLTKEGIYTFDISVETDKYKDVEHSVSSIQIFSSRCTSKWTLCNHPEDCTISQHSKMEPLATVIRLNEKLQEDIFIQKYDAFDNRQMFEKPLDLEIMILTTKGLSLEMRSKVQANFVKASHFGRCRLQIKNLLFKSGLLEAVQPTYEGVLHVRFQNDQYAEISCKVLPGSVASIQVKDSQPLIPKGSLCFQDALQPGEIIKNLTLQGLDAFGNTIEKGQKLFVQLEGLEFQDQNAKIREVDDYGCLQLGGLLKVTSAYNSKGSITIIAVDHHHFRSKLCSITFETVTRQLVATQVPEKSFVGRHLEGIGIGIVDECNRVDTTVDGYMHSITADWLEGVTFVFAKGICTLPKFKLPEKPGIWEGKVYFSADHNLSVKIPVELELADACSLGPARTKRDVLTVQCGVRFNVPFSVYDDQRQPALLTESMKETISADAKDPGAEGHPIFRPHRISRKDVKKSKIDISGYEAGVVLSGSVGTYVITLKDSLFKLKGQVEITCNLEHGHVARLSASQSDGTHVQSLSRQVKTLEAKRLSPLPRLTVTLLDSEDNVCSSCEGMCLRMNVLDCAQWNVKTAVVVRGIAHFESSSIVLPVGTYDVSIQLDSSPADFYSLEEHVSPIKVQFVLEVRPGNYPSALRLLNPDTVSVSLTQDAIQYLPPMTVLVESADRLRLQSRPTVGVKVHGDNNSQDYFGTFVTTSDPLFGILAMRENDLAAMETGGGSIVALRYEFTEVCVPPLAGTYVMEFFVRGTDLQTQSQHLTVRHGPPTRLEIIQREPGQELDVLQVHVVDAHGNTCADIYGLEVSLDLAISKNFDVTQVVGECAVCSKSTAVVKGGKGDFGVFELSKGVSAMCTLRVTCDGYMDPKVSLSPAEVRIFVTRGNVDETIRADSTLAQVRCQEYNELLRLIPVGEQKVQNCEAALFSSEDSVRRLQEELRIQEARKNAVRERLEAARDDEVFEAERAQPLRTVEAVERDLHFLAKKGNSAALALWEAQCEGNFLANPVAKDILGLVVMIGRVESEALNRCLSEYLGLGTLLLIISRSQEGVSALEEYHADGTIDDTKGLHAFARRRGYRVTGSYNAQSLMDIWPYKRDDGRPIVDPSYPQRLLNIDAPRLRNGEVPLGFLGYAVNLIHLSPEHIQVRVATRRGREFGLRESLFFSLLGFTQVYDTRRHMISAKEGLREGLKGGAISLDGGVHSKNQRQQLGRRSDRVALQFSMVPLEERMTASLLPPACYTFQRKTEINLISAEIQTKQDELLAVRQNLIESGLKLRQAENTVENVKAQMGWVTNKREVDLKRIEELMQAKHTISARNSFCSTPGDSGNSQDSDSERMRAFMM